MIKKILKILVWVLSFSGSLFLLSFVSKNHNLIVLKKISVDFKNEHPYKFITKKEVLERLSDIGLKISISRKKEIDLA